MNILPWRKIAIKNLVAGLYHILCYLLWLFVVLYLRSVLACLNWFSNPFERVSYDWLSFAFVVK